MSNATKYFHWSQTFVLIQEKL